MESTSRDNDLRHETTVRHTRVHDTGFSVLSEGTSPILDVVFVHGFTGHPRDTWTYEGLEEDSDSENDGDTKQQRSYIGKIAARVSNLVSDAGPKSRLDLSEKKVVFWPEDLLAKEIPNIRILTYGYDSHVRHRTQTPANQSTILDYGQNLLHSLEPLYRKNPRPIIFVSHSLGGIIVKEALRRSFGHREFQREYYRVYDLTVALVFFGTPHRGADPRSIVKTIAEKSMRLAGFQVNNQLISGLLPSSERLKELRDEFSKMLRLKDWRVHTFQETYGMRRLSGAKVVNDISSSFDDPTFEIAEQILRNHVQMTKFRGRQDQEFVKVKAALERLVAFAQTRPGASQQLSLSGYGRVPYDNMDSIAQATAGHPVTQKAMASAQQSLPQHISPDLLSLVEEYIRKPSLLKEASDQLHDSDRLATTAQSLFRSTQEVSRAAAGTSMPLICICTPHPSRVNLQGIWGQIQASKFLPVSHRPHCPLWASRKITTRKGRVTYFLPYWVARKALEITFTMTTGAGMFSIGPDTQIVLHSQVDYTVVPAFQLLFNVWKDREKYTDEQVTTKVREIPERLKELFTTGAASWNDIDLWGSSLLHYAVFSFLVPGGNDRLAKTLCKESIEKLLQLNVPLNLRNRQNKSALDQVFSNHLRRYSRAGEVEQYLVMRGIEPTNFVPTYSTMDPWTFVDFLRDFPEILEDISIGLIGIAVVQRSIENLERRLQRADYQSVSERYFRGQTPLHLASAWAPGMQLLLQAGADINAIDERGYLPIHYAINLNCTDTILLLIDGGCSLPYEAPNGELLLLMAHENCSVECQDLIVRGIFKRHEELRELVMDRILELYEEDDIMVEALRHPAVLDGNLNDLVRYVGLHHQLPAHLHVYGPPTPYHRRPMSGGLFLEHIGTEVADRLYAQGFRNFECRDYYGFTPFLESCWVGDLAMMRWFLEHGASPFTVYRPPSGNEQNSNEDDSSSESIDLNASSISTVWSGGMGSASQLGRSESPKEFPLPPSELLEHVGSSELQTELADAEDLAGRMSGVVTALHLYCNFASHHPWTGERFLKAGLRLLFDEKVFAAFMWRDSCSCPCSLHGCTPVSMLIRERGGPGTAEYHNRKTKLLASVWSSIIGSYPVIMRASYRAFARVECFERLGMKHTCCELDHLGIWHLSRKEQREIREEEVSYEEILEKWMLAFDSQLARGKSPEETFFWLLDTLPEREQFPELSVQKWTRHYAWGSVPYFSKRGKSLPAKYFPPEHALLAMPILQSIASDDAAREEVLKQKELRGASEAETSCQQSRMAWRAIDLSAMIWESRLETAY